MIRGPGRRCLECAQRFDPGYVQAERDGLLDDPRYLKNLPPGHPLLANENVFAFGMNTAALEVGQLLSMVVAPSGLADNGAQTYHFHLGTLDLDIRGCEPDCYYANKMVAMGDAAPMLVGEHVAAQTAREEQRQRAGSVESRVARRIDDLSSMVWNLEARINRNPLLRRFGAAAGTRR